jgi:tRNA dimethylallyltransferase
MHPAKANSACSSRQVYRRLDLGTGKLSRAEMQGIKHHLINIVEPGYGFNLFEYQQAALATVSKIFERGKQPVFVGGTGLYIDSVADGYVLVPVKENQALRTSLRKLSRSELLSIVRAEQEDAVPFLEHADERRLIRAIEIIRGGVRYADTRFHRPLYSSLMIGVRWERDVLRGRIRHRLAKRVEAGMIDEVADLRRSGVADQFLHDMGLEYRFILQYLTGELRSREELFEKLAIAIGQFAKRQITWFGRRKGIIWIDGGPSAVEAASKHVVDFLRA